MSSVQSTIKQSKGYFLVGAAGLATVYTYGVPTGNGGSWLPGQMTSVAVTVPANSVLRDMGKTVFVGPLGSSVVASNAVPTAGQNQRVFRKVQWVDRARAVATNGLVNPSNGVNSGLVANDTGYDTFYVELPTNGQAGGATQVLANSLLYVPGMPGLY